MLTDDELDGLARAGAARGDEDAGQLDEAVRARREEKAAAGRERIATLRAMDDWEVVCRFLQIAQPDAEEVLGILRDAGFVRHAGIEAAYRAGFEASGEGWNGEHPGDASERPSFAQRMEVDLDAVRGQQREAL